MGVGWKFQFARASSRQSNMVCLNRYFFGQIPLKLKGLLASEGNLDETLEMLNRLDVERTSLSAFEKELVEEAQAYL